MINYKNVNKELDSLCEGVNFDITILSSCCSISNLSVTLIPIDFMKTLGILIP